jgi:hypothetical protein
MAQPVDAHDAIPDLELAGLPIVSVSQEVLALPRPRVTLGDEPLTKLAAAVLSVPSRAIATLAEGLGVAIPAIREGLLAIADRRVQVVEDVATLSDDALAVLMIICVLGEPRRRDLEAYRREDCASLLDRLRRRGFVEGVGEGRRGPSLPDHRQGAGGAGVPDRGGVPGLLPQRGAPAEPAGAGGLMGFTAKPGAPSGCRRPQNGAGRLP